MTNKPETRLVYSKNDLGSLVAGDRVMIDELGDGDHYLAVYEGSFQGKKSFLNLVIERGCHYLTRIMVDSDDISFDGQGRLETGCSTSDEVYEFLPSEDWRYVKELSLLQQSGLYKNEE